MSPVVTDRPRSLPLSSRVVLAAATWAIGGAAIAAGGWVAGLTIAHGLLGVLLVAHDLPAGRVVEFGLRLAAIGGGWGLLVGLVAGLIRREELSVVNRIAAGSVGAVGGAVFGLIGGGLVPASVAAVGRALPVEVSSTLGWAVAGMLAGLVAFGWTQVREKPQPEADEEPDEVTEPGLPPTGEGWPRSLVAAGKWAAGGMASAACAWMIGLMAVRIFLGFGPLAVALGSRPGESAVVVAGFGGGCGLLIGTLAGLICDRPKRDYCRVATTATGGVGGLLIGLLGGILCPFPVAAFGRAVPVEVSSALGWAFVGALAGLVAHGWSAVTAAQARRVREREQQLRELTEED